jgi:signal transduction histidine kinase
MPLYQRRLWVYLMAALLPLAVFSMVMMWVLESQQHAALEAMMREAATSASNAVDSQVGATVAVLSALATSRALEREDWTEFAEQARPVVERAGWLTLAVTDADHQLFNLRGPAPAVDRVGMAEALATGRPAVSNLIPPDGYVTEFSVVIRIPLLREGRPPRTLAAFLPSRAITQLLHEHIPEKWITAVADRDGTILARSRAPDLFVGTKLAPTVFAAWSSGRRTVFEAVTKEGIASYGRISPAGTDGWSLAMGAPKEVVDGPYSLVRRGIWLGGAVAGLLTLLLTGAVLQIMARGRQAERMRVVADAERRLNDRLTAIANEFPGVIFRQVRHRDDAGPVFDYLSPAATRLGLRVGEPGCGRMVEEDQLGYRVAVDQSHRNLRPWQLDVRFRLEDGSLRWMRISAHPRRFDGDAVVWDGVMVDVTDQLAIEKALTESRERLGFALESANAGMWDWDFHNDSMVWSPELRSLYGVPPDFVPSYDAWLGALYADDRGRAADHMARMLAERATDLRLEFRVSHPVRGLLWLLALGRVAFAADGSPLRASGINLDITERKAMEAAMEAAVAEAERANTAKSRFLAAASHDIRQPIQSLMLFGHALAARLKGHAAAPLVEKMLTALGSLKLLLDSILDISKLDAGLIVPERTSINVGDFLHRLAAEYQPRMAAKGLSFRVVDCAACIDSDPILLGRLVGNLLDNALKYTSQGGVVLGCRHHGASLRIAVYDTGAGIAAANHDAVFEEFTQFGTHGRDRAQGLGLGLATVKRMAALLGHSVGLRSQPGRGSAFWVEVGCVETSCAAPAPAISDTAGPGCRRVLVVDDELAILEGMRVLLESAGHNVVLAGSADEAVEQVRMGFEPDVVVTDYRLPRGRNGSEVIRSIREACRRTVPCVVLTGDTEMTTAGWPSTTLMHKPVDPRDLERAIGRLCPAA